MLRLLLVTNRTCPCPELIRTVLERTRDEHDHEVHMIAPALNSRLRHMLSDVDQAVEAARARLEHTLRLLREAGVTAKGEVADADPFLAIQDALTLFRADEIIISTLPPGHQNWLEKGLIERARTHFRVPVKHETDATRPTDAATRVTYSGHPPHHRISAAAPRSREQTGDQPLRRRIGRALGRRKGRTRRQLNATPTTSAASTNRSPSTTTT